MRLFTVILALASCFLQAEASDLQLEVTVTGLSGEAGSVLLGIYNSKDGFPDKPVKYTSVDVSEGQKTVTIRLSGIEIGSYAATLLHDTDGDEEMDSNFIGIPREGFAFSNNAKPTMLGVPSFSTCKFSLQESRVISLQMIYY